MSDWSHVCSAQNWTTVSIQNSNVCTWCRKVYFPTLPPRVIVDESGAFWRDFTVNEHGGLVESGAYSMCPVSDDNDPITVRAVYIRRGLESVRWHGGTQLCEAPGW